MTSIQQMPAVGSGAAEGELDQWWLWGLQAEDFGSPGWSHGQLILWMSCPVSWKINSRGWVSFISLSPPSSLSVSEADCRYLMCEGSVAFRCVWHHRCGWCPSQWRSVFCLLQLAELAFPQYLCKDTADLCCGGSSPAKLRLSLVSRFLPLRTKPGLWSWRGADLLAQTAGTAGLEEGFWNLYYHQAKIWYLWSLLTLWTWGQAREAGWTWISLYKERK